MQTSINSIQNALDRYNEESYYPVDFTQEFINKYSERAASAKRSLIELLQQHPEYDEQLRAIPLTLQVEFNGGFYNILTRFLTGQTSDIICNAIYAKTITPELYEIISPKKPDNLKRAVALAIYKELIKFENSTKEADQRASALMRYYPEPTQKFYLSAQPADILTSSNPKHTLCEKDSLVSCHSLNNQHCTDFKTGAQSLAMDKVTLILFQVNDIDSKQRYTRKTFRQLYFYNRDILLQSRQYSANGDYENQELMLLVINALIECGEAQLEDNYAEFYEPPATSGKESAHPYAQAARMHPRFMGFCDFQYPFAHQLFSLFVNKRFSVHEKPYTTILIGSAPTCYTCGNLITEFGMNQATGNHDYC